jgi:hypothetical protein
MRARHRHFNPKDAGATAAFDARYGVAVADAASVDTWTNRGSGSNATASGTARPTFRATGGNNSSPALEFDGALQQLTHTISLTGAPNLMMALVKRTGGSNFDVIAAFMPPNTANFNTLYALGFGSGSPAPNWGCVPVNSGQSILNTWRICTAKPNSTATSNSSTTVWTDGANEQTDTGSRYAGDGNDRRKIGGAFGASETMVGSISLVTAIPADVGNPLRKRLEHAAAYSFKISCN